jgi:NADH:ubiquinone oxidoreductase subunit 5 (subunit L)/multisubunit Na+/H+ antiporter MnhA subunit
MSAALALLLLAPFAGALAAALSARPRRFTPLAAALAAVAVAATLAFWLLAQDAEAALALPWVPALGLALSFRADRIALGAVLAIALVAGAGAAHTAPRLDAGRERSAQLATLLCIAGLSQALVLASSLAPVAALAALDALALLPLEAGREPANHGTRTGLLLRLAGAWALLAAALLVRDAIGADSLAALAEQAPLVRSQPLFPLLAALLWIGVLSRFAAWPWSAWLARGSRRPGAGYGEALLAITGAALALRFAPLTAAWLPPFAVAVALGIATLAIAVAARALAPPAGLANGRRAPPAGEPQP